MRNIIGSSVLPLRPFFTSNPLLREQKYMLLEEVARKGLMSQIGECQRLPIFFKSLSKDLPCLKERTELTEIRGLCLCRNKSYQSKRKAYDTPFPGLEKRGKPQPQKRESAQTVNAPSSEIKKRTQSLYPMVFHRLHSLIATDKRLYYAYGSPGDIETWKTFRIQY